jgi:hypothetical protein
MKVKKLLACVLMLMCANAVNSQELKFKSYHVYTTDEDKYVQSNEQLSESKICIDETNQEIELSLFNREAGKWIPFQMKIDYKVNLGINKKNGTLYICTNNANRACSVYFSESDKGLFVELTHFFEAEKAMSCWMSCDAK